MDGARKLRIYGIGAGIVAAASWVFGVPLATVLFIGVWLLCPLMMMGMHGGHGHGSHQEPRRQDVQDGPPDTADAHGRRVGGGRGGAGG